MIRLNTTLRVFLTLAGIYLFAPYTFAQTTPKAVFSHSLNLSSESYQPRPFVTVPETLRILAVMVEFKEENPDDDRSSGNGRFDLGDSSKKIIDMPPHDRRYFEHHLSFAENYYRKVSNGKLIVKGTVLDSIYRLPDSMRAYSPPRGSTTLTELGKLMNDTWRIVDSVSRMRGDTIPFQNYQAFIIFHAGVGHDIDLVSLYGYDPTPFDIPSIYLNLVSLKKMFGDNYQGVPVADSTFFIRNSMILPETETRKLQSIGGTVTIALGINGLLVASIGSHLGLPDLFDTKTGRSAIGRFGLMDGQSIFSWGGIFPPEPSAWEKYFLGWLKPITLSSGDATYELPAVGLNSEPDSVYRVLISERECFLVENRNRDANRDGATVTMIVNGDTIQKTWMRDTVNFDFFDQDSLYGVVIDVDEFDWSLPGGNFVVNRAKDWYDGGILIWHIDENVIEANYATGTVNANPDHRGVDLEEGDGAQDIGQSYGFLSPGSGTEDGTPFDFWFMNNPLRQRQLANEFTPTSAPNSLSNDGANSHVYIKEFSTRGPRMTARIQVGDDIIKPLNGFPKNIMKRPRRNSLTVFENNFASGILIATESRPPNVTSLGHYFFDPDVSFIFGWNYDGTPLFVGGDTTGLLFHTSSERLQHLNTKIAVGDFNNDNITDVTVGERGTTAGDNYSFMRIWSLVDQNNDQLMDTILTIRYNVSRLSSPVVSDSFIAYSTIQKVHFIRISGNSFDTLSLQMNDSIGTTQMYLFDNPDKFISISLKDTVRIVTPAGVIAQRYIPNVGHVVTGVISQALGKCLTFHSEDGYVNLLDSNLNPVRGFPVFVDTGLSNSPALADIDGDGQRDIIVFSKHKIWAINAAGAVLDNFPIIVNTDNRIRTSPIVADLDGNGTVDIVAVTQKGLVVAYDKTGKMVRGFPLLAGPNGGSTPAAFTFTISPRGVAGIGLAVASDDGHVYAWQTGTLGPLPSDGIPAWNAPWPQYMRDAQNSGLVEDALIYKPLGSDFFPASRVYNWPNPVSIEQNFKTYIRYYLRDNAKVTIKIFDMAGDLVADFPGPGVGGFDNEVEWDVSDIQSGVYFAHIDAQGTSASGSAVIKIAVIK